MRYADEEKKNLVQRYQAGESSQSLCTKYGISRSTLYRWVKAYCVANPDGKRTFTTKEYDILCHRLEKAEHIIEILKTVHCTVHADLKERLSELEQLYGQYDIHTLCAALNVDRGTFYRTVINAVGHTRHTLDHPGLHKLVVKCPAGVLVTSVTVEQGGGTRTRLNGFVKGFENK